MTCYDPNSYVKDVIAAKILDCGVQSLRNWRFLGRGPIYNKRGTMVRYKVQNLVDFMEAGRVDPEARETVTQDGSLAGQ